MSARQLKDKPATPLTVPSWRQRRSWLIVALIFALYWFISKPFSSRSNTGFPPQLGVAVNWSKYAYSQYATDQHYLCNSLMVFDSLERLESPADRVLFYPRKWDTEVSSEKDRISQLLVMARDKYKVKLRPVEMYTLQRQSRAEEETWDASINKLNAWNLGEYDRVIHLDSDISLLQNIDELFFLPLSKGSPIALPRAYWKLGEAENQGGAPELTSLLIVIKPDSHDAKKLWDLAAGLDDKSHTKLPSSTLFDMELLNSRYSESAIVLPHRPYALVTGEFRRSGRNNHTHYLGNEDEDWNPLTILNEAKLVHFSDWPLPKPWIMWPNSLLREMRPGCEFDRGMPTEHGCEDRQVWMKLYDDFRRKRKEVCKLLSVPAPDWPPKPKKEQDNTVHEKANTKDSLTTR